MTTATAVPTRTRFSLKSASRPVYDAMLALDEAATHPDIDPRLAELIRIRASQINRCVFCLNMHNPDARAAGESQQRLDQLPAWRESQLFSPPERAALAFTESLTLLPQAGVPDEVYTEAAEHFTESELGAILGMVIAINAWNRIAVGTAMKPPTATS